MKILLGVTPWCKGMKGAESADDYAFVEGMRRVFENFGTWPDTVKFHPSFDPDRVRGLYAPFKKHGAKLVLGGDFYDVLKGHDAYISHPSTTIFQALEANKAAICVDFSKVEYPAPFDGKGVIRLCRAPWEVLDEMAKIEQGAWEKPPIWPWINNACFIDGTGNGRLISDAIITRALALQSREIVHVQHGIPLNYSITKYDGLLVESCGDAVGELL